MNLVANIKTALQGRPLEEVTFFCVGTDRVTGDSFGPIVGSKLHDLGYNVIGKLDSPVHALNLADRIEEIPPGNLVIAVDACLGKNSSVGDVRMEHRPLEPGAGVYRELPKVGQYRLVGIVNVGGFMEYVVLHATPLERVLSMADRAVNAILEATTEQACKEVAVTDC